MYYIRANCLISSLSIRLLGKFKIPIIPMFLLVLNNKQNFKIDENEDEHYRATPILLTSFTFHEFFPPHFSRKKKYLS